MWLFTKLGTGKGPEVVNNDPGQVCFKRFDVSCLLGKPGVQDQISNGSALRRGTFANCKGIHEHPAGQVEN